MTVGRKHQRYGVSRHESLPKHIYYGRYYNARVRGEETSLVDAAPVRAHVHRLMEWGMGHTMIAAAAGCSHGAVKNVARGTYPTLRRETATRIMSVTHKPHPEQALCLAIGARRRVEALQAIGWQKQEIAARAGTSPEILRKSMTRTQIAYATWARVRDVYNEISGTPGESSLTRARAKRLHYVAPLAWYGRDIDHPEHQPDWKAAGIKPADRPVCAKNHEYTAENTRLDHRGRRQCRTCSKANKRRKAEKAA
jgi:hypothetical protein